MIIAQSFSFLLLALVVGFAVGLFVARRGWYDKFVINRPLRRVLNLGPGDVRLIIVHHPVGTNRFLPNVALEDVVAQKNVLEVLSELEFEVPKIFHPENLSELDQKMNLISIGGPIRNEFTRRILSNALGDLVQFVPSAQVPDQVEIRLGKGQVYQSASYTDPVRNGVKSRNRDTALLLRMPNPFNAANAVVVIAGIRGLGTWGASDCLRKSAKALARELDKKVARPKAGFLAIIEVEYENFDIRYTTVKEVAGIEKSAVCDLSSVGFLYIIQIAPDLDPKRLKLGFAGKYDQCLWEQRTLVSTAKVLRIWPCRQSWEMAAIAALTCGLVHRSTQDEVFECDEIDALLARGDAFFDMLPALEKLLDQPPPQR